MDEPGEGTSASSSFQTMNMSAASDKVSQSDVAEDKDKNKGVDGHSENLSTATNDGDLKVGQQEDSAGIGIADTNLADFLNQLEEYTPTVSILT